jgi:hypothetical protein
MGFSLTSGTACWSPAAWTPSNPPPAHGRTAPIAPVEARKGSAPICYRAVMGGGEGLMMMILMILMMWMIVAIGSPHQPARHEPAPAAEVDDDARLTVRARVLEVQELHQLLELLVNARKPRRLKVLAPPALVQERRERATEELLRPHLTR